MAATTSTDKSRKQLYMVIGLGVVLAVIVAIQAPRFLGGGGAEATPPATTEALPTSSGTDGSSTAGGTVNVSGSAVVGGVAITPGVVSKPGEGQLASFSLFDRRDPFVQVVKDAQSGASQDGEPTGVKVTGGGPSASSGSAGASGSGAGPGGSGSVSNPSQLTSATIWVNGTEEAVDVKKRFPKADPTFVLKSLKAKVAQIGVVGGAFTGGGTIPLKMGQTLTLVNTATGARYTLRLLYTGDQPETVQQFTQAEK